MAYDRVQDGERIDQISERLLGNALRFDELIESNPDLDIWYPEANQKIEVDNAE